ncbi:MAG: hypothetical protein ACYTHJ_21875, partial [Planctomycetota bacterium]
MSRCRQCPVAALTADAGAGAGINVVIDDRIVLHIHYTESAATSDIDEVVHIEGRTGAAEGDRSLRAVVTGGEAGITSAEPLNRYDRAGLCDEGVFRRCSG